MQELALSAVPCKRPTGLRHVPLHAHPTTLCQSMFRLRLTGRLTLLPLQATTAARLNLSQASVTRRQEEVHAGPSAMGVSHCRFDASGVLLAAGQGSALAVYHMDEYTEVERQHVALHGGGGGGTGVNAGASSPPPFPAPVLSFHSALRTDAVDWSSSNDNWLAAARFSASAAVVFDISSLRSTPVYKVNGRDAKAMRAMRYLRCGLTTCTSTGVVAMWDPRLPTGRSSWATAPTSGGALAVAGAPVARKLDVDTVPGLDASWTVAGSQTAAAADGAGHGVWRLPASSQTAARCLCDGPRDGQFYTGYSNGRVKLFDARKLQQRAFGGRRAPVPVVSWDVGATLNLATPEIVALARAPRVLPGALFAATAAGLLVHLDDTGSPPHAPVQSVVPCVDTTSPSWHPGVHCVPAQALTVLPTLRSVVAATVLPSDDASVVVATASGGTCATSGALRLLRRVELPSFKLSCVAGDPTRHRIAAGARPGALLMLSAHRGVGTALDQAAEMRREELRRSMRTSEPTLNTTRAVVPAFARPVRRPGDPA